IWNRSRLLFQLLVDLGFVLLLPLGALFHGAHLSPGVPGQEGFGAPRHLLGSTEQRDLPVQFHVLWDDVRHLALALEPPWIAARTGGGLPLYAHGQTGLPFPLHVPVWLLGPEDGTDVMVFWKIEVAALGLFFLLRRAGARPLAAATGAIAYSFGLPLLSWVVVPLAWVLAFAPWAFFLLIGTLRGRRLDAALLAVLLGALCGWSVHPETAAFLFLAVLLSGLVLAWGKRRRVLRLVPPALLACAVAGIGALPTLASIAGSSKLASSHVAPRLPWSLKGLVGATFLVPWRYGHPAEGTWGESFEAVSVAIAVGNVALLLALSRLPRRRHRRLALAVLVAGVAAASLFCQLPLIGDALRVLPIVKTMLSGRATFLIGFAVAILGALALDAHLRSPRRRGLILAAVGVQAAVLALVVTAPIPSARSRFAAAAPLTLAAAAPLLGGPYVVAFPLLALGEAAVVGGGLVPASAESVSLSDAALELRRCVVGEGGRTMGLGPSLATNLADRLGVADLRANDPIRPRRLADLHSFFGATGAGIPGAVTSPWPGLAGAWGVRWLAAPAGTAPASIPNAWEEIYRGADGVIFRNRRALPVLRVATAERLLREAGSASEVDATGFSSTALVEELHDLSGRASLEDVVERPARWRARAVVDGRALVVLHVPLARGWRATIDGREAPLVPADVAAMGVVVGSGSHDVVFRYFPTGLLAGSLLTLAGLLGCVVLAWPRRKAA
ncbi:MAG TPA: YfhO family protein, partial [Thermoanaerobaculia bacterium]|nr:YfhO family protein [Thermoanaerobaculia bacterium]